MGVERYVCSRKVVVWSVGETVTAGLSSYTVDRHQQQDTLLTHHMPLKQL